MPSRQAVAAEPPQGGITEAMTRRLEIDGARISSLEDFYDEVSQRLIPGATWGRNLDAFNDILRGGFGTPEEGFLLVWKNHMISRARLGYPETVRQLQCRLTECHPSNIPLVEKQVAAAERGEGPTVFEWLVAIIMEHGPGGREADDGVELALE